MYPGALSPLAKSGVPHSAQNPRSVQRPPSPMTQWYFAWPVATRRLDSRTNATVTKAPPLARWQSLQWQLNMAMGASVHS